MFFHVFPFFALFKHNLRKHLKNPYKSTSYGGAPPGLPKPLCSKAYSPTTADQVIIIIPQNITIIVSFKSMPTSLQF